MPLRDENGQRYLDRHAFISGGAGLRYLIARTYGLHMGLDLGVGPNGPILYVVFGSAADTSQFLDARTHGIHFFAPAALLRSLRSQISSMSLDSTFTCRAARRQSPKVTRHRLHTQTSMGTRETRARCLSISLYGDRGSALRVTM
jgi:hypothetical protein